jgi:hypothetical protein
MKEKGVLVGTLKGGHRGIINNIIRIDEDKIATACSDHFIRIFNIS